MPREKLIHNPCEYGGYNLNNKYSYALNILDDTIIRTLEHYHQKANATGDDYQVIEVTVAVNEPDYSEHQYDDMNAAPIHFEPSEVRNVISRNNYWWCWTREQSKRRGEHYHFMFIYCGGDDNKHGRYLQNKLASMAGVKSAYCSPRIEKEPKQWAHKLSMRGEDGLDDAVTRYSYRAKVDQKPYSRGKRTFEKCQLNNLIPKKSFC